MKLGSLFDGSGTCPLAASAVGIIPAWASEIEPFPKAVTQSRFPKMVHLGDIIKMNGAEIEPVDVITFGSPCQNLSIAGNGKGLAGQESSLFFEAIRVIQEMRCATNGRFPQIVIWENVYGAFSSTQGEDFRTVIETLWKICEGNDSVPRYAEDKQGRQKWPHTGFVLGDHSSIAWRGLDAQGWGVPQRRKRVFVVLDLGGQCAGRILFEREGLRRDFKKVRRTWEALRPASETSPAEHHRVYAVENHAQDSRVSLRPDNTVQTLAGRMGTGGGNVPLVLVPCFGQASYDEYAPTEQAVTPKATGGNYGGGTENLVLVPCKADVGIANGGAGKKAGSIAFSKEVSPTLKAGASGLQAPVVAIPYTLKIRSGCEGGGKGALIQEDKSATLSCNNDQTLFLPIKTESGEVIYLARKLTPTECASLQGFEKDWCALVPHKDSAEYKMWGNGMAFPCMLYIMEGVQEVLAERYLDNLFGGDTAEP
nr:MAG TPA: Cytosine specific methyltransferase [Caudoviricetes sp.]